VGQINLLKIKKQVLEEGVFKVLEPGDIDPIKAFFTTMFLPLKSV
jgi:hypothetical protein